MRAYDESYLNDSMDALGEMLDYAIVDCEHDPDRVLSAGSSSPALARSSSEAIRNSWRVCPAWKSPAK